MIKRWKKTSISSIFMATMMIGMAGSTFANYSDEAVAAIEANIKMESHYQTQMTSSLSPNDIYEMDIETLLMQIQSQRVQLLDEQLQSQIAQVQERNNVIAAKNDQLRQYQLQLDELETSNLGPTELERERQKINQNITQIKNEISSLSNSNQMEMLRLQSLSNKRNEAFDVMTNFIKKMQDSRSSIIGNMG